MSYLGYKRVWFKRTKSHLYFFLQTLGVLTDQCQDSPCRIVTVWVEFLGIHSRRLCLFQLTDFLRSLFFSFSVLKDMASNFCVNQACSSWVPLNSWNFIVWEQLLTELVTYESLDTIHLRFQATHVCDSNCLKTELGAAYLGFESSGAIKLLWDRVFSSCDVVQ